MLLAVDIGNTNISLGFFRNNHLLSRRDISTKQKSYFKPLKGAIGKNKIDDAIICSVVPPATKTFSKDLSRLIGKSPHIIGKDIKVPVKNLYRKPKQVGQDRLVNAYAGIELYGAPLIVVDFGTAITFDVISRHKEYLGGMILPGLRISLESLADKTALLPKIKLEEPKEFIGRDTKNSMLSGIVNGFAALSDDLTQRIKNKIGRNAKAIGTGGNILLLKKYCKRLDKVNIGLTLEGINLIYNKKNT